MFIDDNHNEAYERYLSMDRTHPQDVERKALFYILAGSEDIRGKGINNFYDFTEHSIKSEVLGEESNVDLCSSSRTLVKLAFNLYNNYHESESVNNTFSGLDNKNFDLAINAVKIRFNKQENPINKELLQFVDYSMSVTPNDISELRARANEILEKYADK
jgi:hypothetical protein